MCDFFFFKQKTAYEMRISDWSADVLFRSGCGGKLRRNRDRLFRFRLAEQLGFTVAELDVRMSSSELTEWMVYEKITGPLGRRRGDSQAATIAATIANANRSKKSKKAQISDFLIQYERAGQRKTGRELLATIRDINSALQGREEAASWQRSKN